MHEDKYLALVLDDESHRRLLSLYHPIHNNTKGDHITIERTVTSRGLRLLGTRPKIIVRRHAWDERVQCVLVSVNDTFIRPDFRRATPFYFHVTLSVADGARSKESNTLIERLKLWNECMTPSEDVQLRLYGTVQLLDKGPD